MPSKRYPDDPVLDPELEALLAQLRDLSNLDDLKDNYPSLPSLDQTLEFLDGLPVWWTKGEKALLQSLKPLLPPKPSRQQVADALRELKASRGAE
jgi:hypothetical protein